LERGAVASGERGGAQPNEARGVAVGAPRGDDSRRVSERCSCRSALRCATRWASEPSPAESFSGEAAACAALVPGADMRAARERELRAVSCQSLVRFGSPKKAEGQVRYFLISWCDLGSQDTLY